MTAPATPGGDTPRSTRYRRVVPAVPPPRRALPSTGGGPRESGGTGSAFARVRLRRPSVRAFVLLLAVLMTLEVLVMRMFGGDTPALPASAAIATSLPIVQWALALPVGPATDVPPTPTPTAVATNPPQPTDTPGPEASLPVVPVIDDALKARLRAVFETGRALGNRPEVFAKVGDSITVSGYFLTDIGCGWLNYGDHGDLADTVDFFRATSLPNPGSNARCALGNSFTRRSVASHVGWMAVQVFSPPDDAAGCAGAGSALQCEVQLVRPGTALIMFGTNEVHGDANMATYEAGLRRIVTELTDGGVIPVLSTIPPRGSLLGGRSRVGVANGIVVRVAQEQQVPLWNYWRAMADADLFEEGLAFDGIHPNAYHYGGSFSATGLRFGMNIRNLTALQVLDTIRRVVFEDGPAG